MLFKKLNNVLEIFLNNLLLKSFFSVNDIAIFSDIGGYTTTGGTLPVDIVSRLKPDMVFHFKKGQCHSPGRADSAI